MHVYICKSIEDFQNFSFTVFDKEPSLIVSQFSLAKHNASIAPLSYTTYKMYKFN